MQTHRTRALPRAALLLAAASCNLSGSCEACGKQFAVSRADSGVATTAARLPPATEEPASALPAEPERLPSPAPEMPPPAEAHNRRVTIEEPIAPVEPEQPASSGGVTIIDHAGVIEIYADGGTTRTAAAAGSAAPQPGAAASAPAAPAAAPVATQAAPAEAPVVVVPVETLPPTPQAPQAPPNPANVATGTPRSVNYPPTPVPPAAGGPH